MEHEEAKQWLAGNRSTWNKFCDTARENENALLLTCKADAAMTEQAYWILRAHNAGLIEQATAKAREG